MQSIQEVQMQKSVYSRPCRKGSFLVGSNVHHVSCASNQIINTASFPVFSKLYGNYQRTLNANYDNQDTKPASKPHLRLAASQWPISGSYLLLRSSVAAVLASQHKHKLALHTLLAVKRHMTWQNVLTRLMVYTKLCIRAMAIV